MADNPNQQKLKKFKAIIRQLESSDGKNLNHAPVASGLNKGQQAGGAYGILPNTLNNFVASGKNKGELIDPRLDAMSKLPPEVVTQILNEDRELDDKAADLGMGQVLPRADWDEEKAAYGWNTGHNRDYKNLSPEYKDFDYVQKYRKLAEEMPVEDPGAISLSPKAPVNDGIFNRLKRLLGAPSNGQK